MKHLGLQRISGGHTLQTLLNTGPASKLDQDAQSSRLLHPARFHISDSPVLRLFIAALPSRTANNTQFNATHKMAEGAHCLITWDQWWTYQAITTPCIDPGPLCLLGCATWASCYWLLTSESGSSANFQPTFHFLHPAHVSSAFKWGSCVRPCQVILETRHTMCIAVRVSSEPAVPARKAIGPTRNDYAT